MVIVIRAMPGNFGDLVIVDKNLTIRKIQTPATFENLEVNGSKVNLLELKPPVTDLNPGYFKSNKTRNRSGLLFRVSRF